MSSSYLRSELSEQTKQIVAKNKHFDAYSVAFPVYFYCAYVHNPISTGPHQLRERSALAVCRKCEMVTARKSSSAGSGSI